MVHLTCSWLLGHPKCRFNVGLDSGFLASWHAFNVNCTSVFSFLAARPLLCLFVQNIHQSMGPQSIRFSNLFLTSRDFNFVSCSNLCCEVSVFQLIRSDCNIDFFTLKLLVAMSEIVLLWLLLGRTLIVFMNY